ncbi:hypothetical protein O4158_21325 [Gordonia amicalis]|uniref:hypothetical protein n=1 Tax=Mycobacteriales TaxID=85007 RepID=UPI0022B50F51|nr:hypothetical protein [Gordonia amicalis]MCZ4581583.1 hypothetical protein [Gordonia amicalis]
MPNPALEAAHRAVESLDTTTALVPDDWDVVAATSIAAAEEALIPIREVLDRLARNTQAPCGPEKTAAARVDALNAIAELVRSTDTGENVTHEVTSTAG